MDSALGPSNPTASQWPESPSPFKDAPADPASVFVGTATPEGGGEDLERHRRSGRLALKPSPTPRSVLRLPAPARSLVVSTHTFRTSQVLSVGSSHRPPLMLSKLAISHTRSLGGFLGTPIPSERFPSHPGVLGKKLTSPSLQISDQACCLGGVFLGEGGPPFPFLLDRF